MSSIKMGVLKGTGKEELLQAKELGVDYVDLHFRSEEELMEALQEAEKLGIEVVVNIESRPLSWIPSEKLRAQLEKSSVFSGFMLDECDHMQLNAHWPVVEYYGYGGRHYFAETDHMTLDEAQEAVGKAIQKRVQELTINGKDVAGEYLYPGMMHTAAKAGLSASPKILKETCGPVMLAAGLGASLQYGGTFGVDCDAWWHPETVGHTDVRFWSALQLAYWVGADRVYMEGGFGACQHPSEESQPLLMKKLAQEYIQSHPRAWSWRDYRPETAIIRQDDTCFDIRQQDTLEYPGPLYGHIPAKEENTEWLNILSLLSHGYIRNDSASRNWEGRSVQARTLFAPFYKMAIFDETVTGSVLDSVQLFFLSGPKISNETWADVAKRVKAGATCVIPERFVEKMEQIIAEGGEPQPEIQEECRGVCARTYGKGTWITMENMYSLHYETWTSGPCNPLLHKILMPLIGDGEHLVYDFGTQTVSASLKTRQMKNGRIYHCNEIPRAVMEEEDCFKFEILENKSES